MGSRLEYVEKHSGSLEDFIRKNSEYYLESWKSEKIKFNFAAFLFETLWFAYRKMYKSAVALLILHIAINVITILFLLKTKFFMAGTIITLVIRVYIGFKANDFYFIKAEKVLERRNFEPENNDCGTSILGVVIIISIAIVFQVLLDFYLRVTYQI